MDPDEERLRRRRDGARRVLIVAMVLLILFGFGFGFANYVSAGGGGDMLAIFVSVDLAIYFAMGILVVCGGAAAAWMYWGWRLHRAHDPWGYDPELDGPDPRVRRGLEHAEREERREMGDRPPP